MTYPPQQYPPTNYPPAHPMASATPVVAQYAPPVFLDPAAAGPAPALRNLAGRVVAFEPTAYDPTKTFQNDPKPKPQITTNMIVSGLDDQGRPMGPIDFGDNLTTGTPSTSRVSLFPAEFTGVWISNTAVVPVLQPAVPDPAQGRAGGVIIAKVVRGTQGKQGQPPWLLEAVPADHPARAELTAAFQARYQDRNALKRPIEPLAPAAAPGAGYPGPMAAPPATPQPAGLPPQVNYGQAPAPAPMTPNGPANQWPGIQQTPNAHPPAGLATPAAPASAPRQGADGGWYVAPVGWPEQAWQTIPNPEAYGTRVG